MQVRQATANDAADISRIYALSWKAAYRDMVPQEFLDDLKEDHWVSYFHHTLADGSLSALMISDDSQSVGCAAFGRSRDESLSDWGEIVSIYLHPHYFGKRYGETLLHGAVDALAQQGYSRIYLWVLRENVRARRFYEKHGFVCRGDECTVEIMGQQLVDLRYVYVK
jgi:ribosomal protein S18 acetylase RimI-like enzyme